MNTFGAPTLITRNTNDVQQVQMFLQMALTVMVTAPLMAIGGVIMAYRQDGPLSLLLVVIVPIMLLLIGAVMVRAVPLFRPCRSRSTGSTGSCARTSRASGSSARSCAPSTRRSASPRPTTTSPTRR